jgi:hypothetical protein
MSLARYQKILALGHRTIRNIFEDPVEITEKIDGSQFSFGKVNGELLCRSKGADLIIEAPQALFVPAIAKAKSIKHLLPEDITFFGETLQRPKHNVLVYDRVPQGHIALFGIMNNVSKVMLDYQEIQTWANRLGIDAVPCLHYGLWKAEDIPSFMNRDSYLGGTKIEGVVVKNYNKDAFVGDQYLPYLVGKYVSEKFKEQHGSKKYGGQAVKSDIESYFKSFNTEARFQKAIIHLREKGLLKGEPQDIGPLLKELNTDFETECKEEIKEFLWQKHRQQALRMMSYGFATWYKEQLLKEEIE